MNTEATQQAIHVRWMIRRDMPEVLAIEAASFESPWLEADFIRCLRQRNCIGMVAEHKDRVVGLMVHTIRKKSYRIERLAVDPDWRRHGVGRRIVHDRMKRLSPNRRNRMVCEVRESNLAAQCFFRQLGFRAVGTIPGFYRETPEAAITFEFRVFGEFEV